MQANDVRLLRGSAVVTAAAGVVAAIAALLAAGTKGLIGALFATVVVLVFFSIGQVAIGRISKKNPYMIMNMALFTYIVQIMLLGLVLFLFKGTTAFDTKVFGLTILGATLVWVASQVYVFTKLKIAYVEPDGER
jgi:ATP synthase protein I